jgi:hypothetical protein
VILLGYLLARFAWVLVDKIQVFVHHTVCVKRHSEMKNLIFNHVIGP